MTKHKNNATTILLGLKNYKVGKAWGGIDRVVVETAVKGRPECPHCRSGKLY